MGEGDSLVKIEDDLVIFLEPRQVEQLLGRAETQLNITVERFVFFSLHHVLIFISRGHIEPLCVCEETPDTASINMGTDWKKEMVTIVINKEKGVWTRK